TPSPGRARFAIAAAAVTLAAVAAGSWFALGGRGSPASVPVASVPPPPPVASPPTPAEPPAPPPATPSVPTAAPPPPPPAPVGRPITVDGWKLRVAKTGLVKVALASLPERESSGLERGAPLVLSSGGISIPYYVGEDGALVFHAEADPTCRDERGRCY